MPQNWQSSAAITASNLQNFTMAEASSGKLLQQVPPLLHFQKQFSVQEYPENTDFLQKDCLFNTLRNGIAHRNRTFNHTQKFRKNNSRNYDLDYSKGAEPNSI